MPSYHSDGGKWYPAREKVGLHNKSGKAQEWDGKIVEPNDPFVYDGPDREALKELHIQDVEYLGKDFKSDPEFLQAVRNMGYQSVDDYLKATGYDEAKAKKEFEEKASVVKRHELPKRINEVRVMGGGRDFAGNKQDLIGGFGDQRERPASELVKGK